jgi:hypothetical protein
MLGRKALGGSPRTPNGGQWHAELTWPPRDVEWLDAGHETARCQDLTVAMLLID